MLPIRFPNFSNRGISYQLMSIPLNRSAAPGSTFSLPITVVNCERRMTEIRLGVRFCPFWMNTPVDTRAQLRRERERLLKLLMQELGGTLPGNTSSLGVILRAILLEEPMFGPWIRIEGGLPPRCLELLLHLGDRLSWLEGVILRKVAEVCGVRTAKVEYRGRRHKRSQRRRSRGPR
jgi:hypothetical protein